MNGAFNAAVETVATPVAVGKNLKPPVYERVLPTAHELKKVVESVDNLAPQL